MTRRRWLLISIIAALIVLLVVLFFRFNSNSAANNLKNQNAGRERATPVSVGTVVQGDFPIYLDALGTVTAKTTAVIRPRVDGQLLSINFQEGQWVKEGALLAEIDPRPFQVQLAQAMGQLQKDKALLINAELDLSRYKKLLEQDSISQQQADTQQSLVDQYRGIVASDQGVVDNAKLQLAYTRISAPISGRIGLRQVDIGNMVRTTDVNGVATIVQSRPITVLFSVPAEELPSLRHAMQTLRNLPVDLFDSALKNKIGTGRLTTFDNQIDVASGTVKLRAEFPNNDDLLYPNQFVNVRLLLQTRKAALSVPASAVQTGQGGSRFVYLLQDDNKVTVRTITAGATNGLSMLIEQGLKEDDKVIIDGTDKLREGSQVTPVTAHDVKTDAQGDVKERPKEGEKKKRWQKKQEDS